MRLWYSVNRGKQSGCGPRWTEKAGRCKKIAQNGAAALWERHMTPYETYSLIGQYIGLGLIFYGIWQMQRGTEYRERESVRRHEENMRRLDESMEGMRALIEGQKVLIKRTGG